MITDFEVAETTLLLAGPWEKGEFAAVRGALEPPHPRLIATDVCEAIERVLDMRSPPELLAIAQPRPGQFDETCLRRLAAEAPLTRVVVAAGSWCEGELRTGKPPAGAIRLYWYEFAAWLRANLRVVNRGDCPPWSAPLDEPRAGTWVGKADMTVPRPRGRVIVSAGNFHTFAAVNAALSPAGWECAWEPRHRPDRRMRTETGAPPAAAGIFDGGQLDADELDNFQKFAERLGGGATPFVVLLDFPRAEHVELARIAGATAVIGKPYQTTLLREALEVSKS